MNYFLNSTVNQLLWINFIRTCQVEMNGSKPQVFFSPKTDFILFHYFIKSYEQLFRCEQQKHLVVILIFCFDYLRPSGTKPRNLWLSPYLRLTMLTLLWPRSSKCPHHTTKERSWRGLSLPLHHQGIFLFILF